jgi:hypothetical protein
MIGTPTDLDNVMPDAMEMLGKGDVRRDVES